MSYKPHSSQLSLQAGQMDQVEQSHHMQDQQQSFNSAKLKPENWQNLNDFQDSEMVIESSSDQARLQSDSNQSFIETTKKALGQFKQIKELHDKESIKFEEPSVQYQVKLQQYQIPSIQSSNYKVKKIRKSRKNQGKRERKRKTPKTCHSFLQNHMRRSRDQFAMNSLKNISSSVCDFVEKVSKISYPQLFNKFVNESGNESKNLKRRMYDVINVLSSVKIIKKKGHMLSKSSYKLALQNQNNSDVQDTADSKMIKIKKLKEQVEEKQQKLRQKRQLLVELKEKKKNLQRLYKRNQKWEKHIPQTNVIRFPFLCFVPQANTNCHVSPQQAKLVIANNGTQDIQNVITQTDAVKYINLKRIKKLPTSIRSQVSFDTVKGISTTQFNMKDEKLH